MSDLISRADAIEAVCSDCSTQDKIWCKRTRGCCDDVMRIKELPSAVCDDCIWTVCNYNKVDWDAPSAEAVQWWIPCNERLPKEEKKTYWVCTDTGHQCECRWTNNLFGIVEGEWGWSIFDTPQYTKPIAWRPLPKPYKGGDDE